MSDEKLSDQIVDPETENKHCHSLSLLTTVSLINMADAAARREARRKRILENSENRLRIISGLPKVGEFSLDVNLRLCSIYHRL